MKGSIGTSLQGKMLKFKEWKLSNKEKKRLARVKPRKHRIKTEHNFLEDIANKRNARESKRKQMTK